MEVLMFPKIVIVFAIALLLGNIALSAGAFAYGGGLRGGRSHSDHFARSFAGRSAGSVYDGRASDLRGGFSANGGDDLWGHWGAYYGPMVPPMI
jgi:hypothetical protein